MLNFYEILQVSENASEEIIEKAYKVLAKKYHPDLQQVDKDIAEEKMKQINDAYETLKDKEKRKIYDEKLKRQKLIEEERWKQEFIKQQESQDTSISNIQSEKVHSNEEEEIQRVFEEEMQRGRQIAYEQAYYKYLRDLGYKVKTRWTFKKFLNFLKAITIMVIILFILWQIPPIRNWIINFYENNAILKMLVDVIGNIIKVFWNAIVSIWENPPQV